MQVLNFADFARRKTDASKADVLIQTNAVAPVVDRWAMLHAEPSQPSEAAAEDRDFFADLELRMAYPTHALRHH